MKLNQKQLKKLEYERKVERMNTETIETLLSMYHEIDKIKIAHYIIGSFWMAATLILLNIARNGEDTIPASIIRFLFLFISNAAYFKFVGKARSEIKQIAEEIENIEAKFEEKSGDED